MAAQLPHQGRQRLLAGDWQGKTGDQDLRGDQLLNEALRLGHRDLVAGQFPGQLCHGRATHGSGKNLAQLGRVLDAHEAVPAEGAVEAGLNVPHPPATRRENIQCDPAQRWTSTVRCDRPAMSPSRAL